MLHSWNHRTWHSTAAVWNKLAFRVLRLTWRGSAQPRSLRISHNTVHVLCVFLLSVQCYFKIYDFFFFFFRRNCTSRRPHSSYMLFPLLLFCGRRLASRIWSSRSCGSQQPSSAQHPSLRLACGKRNEVEVKRRGGGRGWGATHLWHGSNLATTASKKKKKYYYSVISECFCCSCHVLCMLFLLFARLSRRHHHCCHFTAHCAGACDK